MNSKTKFFIVMMAVNILITLVSFSYIIGGFIKQDVQQIGLSLIPLIFYGLTFLSMLLYWMDDFNDEFVKTMAVMNGLLLFCSILIIIGGFIDKEIMLLNWGFPILIISALTFIAILREG